MKLKRITNIFAPNNIYDNHLYLVEIQMSNIMLPRPMQYITLHAVLEKGGVLRFLEGSHRLRKLVHQSGLFKLQCIYLYESELHKYSVALRENGEIAFFYPNKEKDFIESITPEPNPNAKELHKAIVDMENKSLLDYNKDLLDELPNLMEATHVKNSNTISAIKMMERWKEKDNNRKKTNAIPKTN